MLSPIMMECICNLNKILTHIKYAKNVILKKTTVHKGVIMKE